MADTATDPKACRPRARQSIAHLPSLRSSAFKDNVTTDIAALQIQKDGAQAAKKKSRGKSLGPGGLEALTESIGNVTKTSAPFQIKSILKPTVPLTPPKAIPTFDELRKRSTGKGRSPRRNGGEDLLIDFSTPGPSRQDGSEATMPDAGNIADPFSPIRRRTPARSGAGDADAIEREREEELKRKAEKQAILERRAARRKSLANRRVSFAPEATLHTWSVMELAEDSTTSSASNSTRRQSSMTAAQSPVTSTPSAEATTVPSTPTEEPEHQIIAESPAHQRDLHQKKRRRRSSGLSEPMLDASQDEVFSSSPSGDVTTNSSPLRVEEGIESSDESDTDGDTAMSLDDGTAHTINSQDSGSSTHSSLEDRLRQAASQAGTRGIEYDEESDDLSMELATGTVTNAFQPWARNRAESLDNSAIFDQENVDPFDSSHKAATPQQSAEDGVDENQEQTKGVSMDVTKAVGRIVSRQSPSKKSGKSPLSRRRSSVRHRRSSGGDSISDEPMEFTIVEGGIIGTGADAATGNTTNVRPDEEVTMEFTTAVGGVLGGSARRESGLSEQTDENESMDMTTAVGGILAPIEEQTEPQTDVEDEQTMGMEMTRAVGSILNQTPVATKRVTRKSLGSGTVPNTASTTPKGEPTLQASPESTPKSHQHLASVASETGSPSLALKPRLSGRPQRSATKPSTTPQSKPPNSTPIKSTTRTQNSTPSKQVTPLPARAENPPNKTPLSANVAHRGASPKRLFKAEIKARSSPGSVKREAYLRANSLFSRDSETGQQTPSVILHAPKGQPTQRRSSGIGVDRDGIGSPRVSEILDRRATIGASVPQFKLGTNDAKRWRLEDPKQVEHEVEAERAEEHRRESGRFIMEQEADQPQEENTTLQLKDMIDAMSPKKQKGKLKGRKSLAVGGAKGLLGKRPAELDMDDEDEADSTPKRLKAVSREGSPVKKVHLPKPPSKDETTGRLKYLQDMANAERITPTVANFSPTRNIVAASPSSVGRYRDAEINGNARPTSFGDKLDNVVGAIDVSTAQMEHGREGNEQEKISLQEFLNMTNIHFIELSTTKRRHTMAQSMPSTESQEGGDRNSTEATFVAAATTLPLLELYQHATRELKSYISTGRKIIRTIEAETLAEQPPLFREYIDARPDVKVVMDNQFRNGKANARLQSKEGWYQWRAQLVEGLRAGLEGINQGMSADLALLDQQQQTLDGVIPTLLREQSELEVQKTSLQQRLQELDSVDQEALNICRQQLRDANHYYLERSAVLNSLQEQMKEKDEALAAAKELKVEMAGQIAEADRVREEHKGWPVADVQALKSKVESIEKRTGWRLLTVEEEVDEPNNCGPALTMVYKDDLRLFFYPQVFQCNATNGPRRRSGRRSASVSGPTAPISLTFAPTNPDDSEEQPPELSTEKRFFLQMIRSQLHVFAMMPKGSVSSKTLLSTVSQGWDVACKVSEEIRLLNLLGITTASILSDERLAIKVVLVLPDPQGRVDIEFTITATILNDGAMVASTNVTANAVYGSVSDILSPGKSRKVQHALGKEVESRSLGEGACVSAARGFQAWLQQQQQQQQKELSKQHKATESRAEVRSPPKQAPAPSAMEGHAMSSASTTAKRSPLAPKRTNVLQKKALPVPKQRLEKFSLQSQQQGATAAATVADKENFNPSISTSKMQHDHAQHHEPNGWAGDKDAHMSISMSTSMSIAQAAIPPEMQEVMMHTPIKRVGALRRSPV